MFDLHTHTFLSDGTLSVSELVYREKCAGYNGLAITDHVDESNIDIVLPSIKKAVINLSREYDIKVCAGVELTYVPPSLIDMMTKKARSLGAEVVVVHGETQAENVPPGTNRAAIIAKVNILAHPGRISEEEVLLAKENDVCLEITSRKGHNATNLLVYELAKKTGAKLVFGNDAHEPRDILDQAGVKKVLESIGITINEYEIMLKNAEKIIYGC